MKRISPHSSAIAVVALLSLAAVSCKQNRRDDAKEAMADPALGQRHDPCDRQRV